MNNEHLISAGQQEVEVKDFEERLTKTTKTLYYHLKLEVLSGLDCGYTLLLPIFNLDQAEKLSKLCGISPRPYDNIRTLIRKCLTLRTFINVEHHDREGRVYATPTLKNIFTIIYRRKTSDV